MEDKLVSTSVTISEDDANKLDQMMNEDMFISRSAFIRKLIRQEWQRRYQPVRMVSDVVAAEQSLNLLSD